MSLITGGAREPEEEMDWAVADISTMTPGARGCMPPLSPPLWRAADRLGSASAISTLWGGPGELLRDWPRKGLLSGTRPLDPPVADKDRLMAAL